MRQLLVTRWGNMVEESVYPNSDNEINWQLFENKFDHVSGEWKEVAIDFISKLKVSKMELFIGNIKVESDNIKIQYFDGGRVNLKLGGVNGLIAKSTETVRLKVYDPLNTKGRFIVTPRNQKSSAQFYISPT